MIAQFVIIKMNQKKIIDFLAIQDAVKSAGYKLTNVYIDATGSGTKTEFQLSGSKQSFAIDKPNPGPSLTGEIVDWKPGPATIKVGVKPKSKS
jgi:hypothetical protein